MQEILIEAAAKSGAEVRRGSRVRSVQPGSPATMTIEQRGRTEELSARLVVGCDGRGSMVRQWAGLASNHDPAKLLFAGVVFDDMPAVDACYQFSAPHIGQISYLFPQAGGRVRAYVGFHELSGIGRFQGSHDLARFQESARAIGLPPELLDGAKPAGPLATFDGADSWVNHPYRDGVALVGDAAATSDPTWGQGMSLTLRDVRVLRDCLLEHDDWDEAGHAYAEQHDRYYGVQHTADGWFAELFMEIGAEADALRERALPRIAADPMRITDCPHSGPEVSCDEAARRRMFGED
jgi:2-polyprenyl-6-methoxyphenol hydroxylase-like FAD-dependent oxidoreductase